MTKSDEQRSANVRENAHRTAVRVYYEDTDFSGRVYHASYLRFFERGRTEWLRGLGFRHSFLAASNQTAFAVTELHVEFLAAARIDDLLDVVTDLRSLRGPILRFHQVIAREGAPLVIGAVDVVAVRGDRPVRPPRDIVAALTEAKRDVDK